MSTPLQTFRDKYPNQYDNYTDNQLLEYIYMNDPAYRDYDFDTFKSLALDLPPPEPKPKPTYAERNPLDFPSKTLLPKEVSRVGAGITEQLIKGPADFIDFAIETARGKPSPQSVKKAYKQTAATLGSLAFGNELVPTTDEEGTTYFTNEKPKTLVGGLAEGIGSFAASLIGGKKIIEEVAKKTKGPIKSKKGKIATTVAAGEVASQVAINPYEATLANLLGTEIADQDNLIGDIVSMLQSSEDKSELENRIALLGEGLILTGAIGSVIGGGKGLVKKLKEVRDKGPEAVESFNKTLLEASQSATKAEDQFISSQSSKEVMDELSFSSNKYINGLQRFWKNISTSRGLYTPEMFVIKQNAENFEKAWAKRAENLAMDLKYQIQRVADSKEFTEKEINKMLNEYLVQKPMQKKTGTTVIDGKKVTLGKKEPKLLEELPKDLQPIAKEIRETIDELSGMLLTSKRIPQEIKKEIQENIGRYLRRSYEIFDNPNYRPSEEVYEDAVMYVAKQLKKDPNILEQINKGKELNLYEEAKSRVDAFLEKPLKGVTYKHYDDMLRADLATKIFAQRKNLAPQLKALFGETRDAPTSVFRTIERMSSFYHRTDMYDKFLEMGKGKYFFKKDDILPEGISSRFKQGRIQGKQFHTLDGMYTTPELARLFQSVEELTGQTSNGLFRVFFASKGMAQASATVGSWYTHIRNTIGGGIIMARNGMNPFSSETRDSFKILQNEFQKVGTDEKALRKLYEEFLSLGLVNQNVRVGDFRNLINDAARVGGNVVSKQAWYREGLNSGKTKALSIAKFAEKLYVAEDDLWRIAGFNKELQTLKKANDILPVSQRKGEDVLKQEAAEIIRNTMPTYSLVPPAAKGLRKLPVGNFFSFHAEQFRNVYHSFIRAREEIFSGNEVLTKRGYQRLAGITTVGMSGGIGLTEATKFAFGVTNEEHEAVRKLMLPEWSKNSDIAYGRNPATGELYYIDLQFTDPTAPVTNLIKASLNEFLDPDVPNQEWEARLIDATEEGMKSFLAPFVDETLLTTAAFDVLSAYARPDLGAGRNIDGFEAGAPAINNLAASFRHILETQIPTTLKQLDPSGTFAPDRIGNQIYKQITENNPTTRYGDDLSLGTELLVNTTGLRFYRIDDRAIERSLEFKLTDLNNQNQTYSRQIRNGIGFDKTYEDALNKYAEQNERYYREYVKGKLAIDGAISLGVKSFRVANIAKEKLNNFDKAERKNLIELKNTFQPLELSEQMLIDILQQNRPNGMAYKTFKRKYANLRTGFGQLPLLELQDKVSDDRVGMSKGGLVGEEFIEGPEVPFTKDNAAQRINPLTGEPYQQQGDALGFIGTTQRQRYSRGELVTSVIEGVKNLKNPKPQKLKTPTKRELQTGVYDLKVSQRRIENDPDFDPMVLYHGSPFSFKKFDASKLLSGEGVNAFGKGLYFTENKNIAKTYRTLLTRKKEIERLDSETKILTDKLADTPEGTDEFKRITKELGSKTQQQIDIRDQKIDVTDKGSLYKVNVKTSPHHLVDWDVKVGQQNYRIAQSFDTIIEKLDNEQLEILIGKLSDYPTWTRDETLYSRAQLISDAKYAVAETKAGDVIPVLNQIISSKGSGVEEFLAKDGVQGIRYFDGFSRKGKSSKRSRNYVIFDPRIIDISKKYAVPIPLAGKMLMEMDAANKDSEDRVQFNTGGTVLSNLVDNIKAKIPVEARLYYDKVVKQDKNPITEKDFTEEEYQNIKNHFKKTLINDIKSGKITFDDQGKAQYIRKFGNRTLTKPVISGYDPVEASPKALEFQSKMGIEYQNLKPSDGNVKDFTNVFGKASYSFTKDGYENSTASIDDVYDFNFEYAGGFNKDFEYKRGSNYSISGVKPRILSDTPEKEGLSNPINRAKYRSYLG